MWLFGTACSFVPIQSCCKFKQEFFRDSRFLSACFITWLNCKNILSVSNTAKKSQGWGSQLPSGRQFLSVFIKKLEGEGRGNLQVIGMLAGRYTVVW